MVGTNRSDSVDEGHLRSARILIVEDEQIVALDMRDTLREMGYDVVGTTGRGEQAVDLARTLTPDLVLMDIHLAGPLDGVAAADRIRQAGGPPVVFVTAFDDTRTVDRAKVGEPYGYLLKPFNVRELRVVIEMALFHHRMQQERARLTRELRDALREVAQLQELLQMCAYCRRIADDDGGWEPFETFLRKRTGTSVSHGICPECFEKVSRALDQ